MAPRASLASAGRHWSWLGLALLLIACSDDAPATMATAGAGAGTGGSGGGGPNAGGAGGGVVGDIGGVPRRYRFAFDVESAAATSEVTIGVTQAGDCYTIPCGLGVTGVEHDGSAARVELMDGTSLRSCGAPVASGHELVLRTQQTVSEQTFLGLDVGFSRTTNLAGGRFSYLLSWVGGCDHFGPCDDAPSRFADFVFDVSHPADELVLCPGALEATATATTCQLAHAPTYSGFAIASDSMWTADVAGVFAGVELVFYEVPGGQLQSSLDLVAVEAFMSWITDLLGPYPYGDQLRIAGAPTRWLGFEHPGNIILREDLDGLSSLYSDPLMHVLMHEVVHQWAGDRTTLAAVADFVWKEATAEYLGYVFEDELGPAGHAAATRAAWDTWSLQATSYSRPLEDPTPPVESFYGDVYGAGPMVLYLQLEALIGRAAVLQAIAAFLAEPVARSVEELKAALELASEQDLTAYFDAWVFGVGAPAWPTLLVETDQTGDEVTVTVTQVGEPFGLAVEVDVSSDSETVTALVDFGLAPQSSSAQAVVTLVDPVTSTAVDPRRRVIHHDGAAARSAPRGTHPWLVDGHGRQRP